MKILLIIFFSKTLWKNSLRKSHLNNFCGQRGMKAAMGKCCLSSDTLASSPNPPSPYLHHLEGALPPRNHHLPHTVMMQKPPSRGYTAPGGGHVRNCWKRICISWNIERLLQLWIIFMSHLLAKIFRVGKKFLRANFYFKWFQCHYSAIGLEGWIYISVAAPVQG